MSPPLQCFRDSYTVARGFANCPASTCSDDIFGSCSLPVGVPCKFDGSAIETGAILSTIESRNSPTRYLARLIGKRGRELPSKLCHGESRPPPKRVNERRDRASSNVEVPTRTAALIERQGNSRKTDDNDVRSFFGDLRGSGAVNELGAESSDFAFKLLIRSDLRCERPSAGRGDHPFQGTRFRRSRRMKVSLWPP